MIANSRPVFVIVPARSATPNVLKNVELLGDRGRSDFLLDISPNAICQDVRHPHDALTSLSDIQAFGCVRQDLVRDTARLPGATVGS
jgi:hypothetical protein